MTLNPVVVGSDQVPTLIKSDVRVPKFWQSLTGTKISIIPQMKLVQFALLDHRTQN